VKRHEGNVKAASRLEAKRTRDKIRDRTICPICKAQPSEYCIARNGKPRVRLHKARVLPRQPRAALTIQGTAPSPTIIPTADLRVSTHS
jgi:hypothetical protein